MKHARTLFLALPLVILSACAGDPVSTAPTAHGASFNENPSATPPPPAVSAGGNTMGSGT
jgi:hypothetical protein